MTLLAFGAKCGKPGRAVSAWRSRESSEASAADPMPVAARPKKLRRVSSSLRSSMGSFICYLLFLRDNLIEVQHQTCCGGVGSQLGWAELGVGRRVARFQKQSRPFGIGAEVIAVEAE